VVGGGGGRLVQIHVLLLRVVGEEIMLVGHKGVSLFFLLRRGWGWDRGWGG
jgi:hypothetical protein